jgi:hypothetical protein
MGWVQIEPTPWMNFSEQSQGTPSPDGKTDQDKSNIEQKEQDRKNAAWQRKHDYSEKLKSGVKIPYFLPYYDTLQTAEETEVHRRAYRQMLSDAYIKSALYSKIFAIMGQDIQVIPPTNSRRDKYIADFVKWNYEESLEEGIPGMVWDILSGALIDGFSVCEKVWMPETEGQYKNRTVLRRLKAKDVNQDLVIHVDEYRNITHIQGLRYNAGQTFSPNDFVIYTHLGLYENPAGMSDLRAVYKDFWMLDTVTKLRAIGAEKRAFPVVYGTTNDANKMDALEEALSQIRSQSYVALPEGVEMNLLNIAGNSEGYFKQFRDDCIEGIFMGIAGATLQAMSGRSGAVRGASTIHKDTADLFKWVLTNAVQNVLNNRHTGLTRDIVVKNFSSVDRLPKTILSGVDDGELAESITVDRALGEMGAQGGWKLDIKGVEEKYGRKLIPVQQPAMGGMPGMPGMGGPPQMPQPGGEQDDGSQGEGDDTPDYEDGATFEEILKQVLTEKAGEQ